MFDFIREKIADALYSAKSKVGEAIKSEKEDVLSLSKEIKEDVIKEKQALVKYVPIAKKVGKFGIDVARDFTTRPMMRAALSILNVASPEYKAYQPEGKAEKLFYGEEPVKSYQTTANTITDWLSKKTGVKAPKISALPLIGVMAFLDWSPLTSLKSGKTMEKLAVNIAKTDDVGKIAKMLKPFAKGRGTEIERIAKAFAKENNPKVIYASLLEFQKIAKNLGKLKTISKEIKPFEEIASRASNADEFVRGLHKTGKTTQFARFLKKTKFKNAGEFFNTIKKINQPIGKKVVSTKIPKEDAISKINTYLKEAKELYKKQEKLRTIEKGKRLKEVLKVRKTAKGKKGFYVELSKLKGKLPTIKTSPIKITQNEIDNLFERIKSSELLNEWDKITAQKGILDILGGKIPPPSEKEKLALVFGKDWLNDTIKVLPEWRKAKIAETILDTFNIPRAVMASFDVSAPLRQGLWFMFSHPKQSLRSMKDMFKFLVSKGRYKDFLENVTKRDTYPLMRKANLALTGLSDTLAGREEAFMSRLVGKMPGIAASERAYVGFLNKVRADVFDDMLKQAIKSGVNINDERFLKSLAEYINTATGRGSLGYLERAATGLNTFFFSPRLMASRFQILNPQFYTKLHPWVRKQALKDAFEFAGSMVGALTLAKLGGADVELDPRSADFAKIKIGNTRYDIMGGFQQLIRLAYQLAKGEIKSSTTGKIMRLGEGYRPLTRPEILLRWFEMKQAPFITWLRNISAGETPVGQTTSAWDETKKLFVPMFTQDLYDLVKYKGARGVLEALPGALGVGVQTYGGVMSWNLNPKEYPGLGKELERLHWSIGFPSNMVYGYRLSPKQYKIEQQVTGKFVADLLEKYVQTPEYKKLPDFQKKLILQRLVEKRKRDVHRILWADLYTKNRIKNILMKNYGIEDLNEADKITDKIFQNMMEKQGLKVNK